MPYPSSASIGLRGKNKPISIDQPADILTRVCEQLQRGVADSHRPNAPTPAARVHR